MFQHYVLFRKARTKPGYQKIRADSGSDEPHKKGTYKKISDSESSNEEPDEYTELVKSDDSVGGKKGKSRLKQLLLLFHLS